MRCIVGLGASSPTQATGQGPTVDFLGLKPKGNRAPKNIGAGVLKCTSLFPLPAPKLVILFSGGCLYRIEPVLLANMQMHGCAAHQNEQWKEKAIMPNAVKEAHGDGM